MLILRVFTSLEVELRDPGDNQMTDDDGDGIYSITVKARLDSHYTFTNGACGDWSCKETSLVCLAPT